MQNTSETRDNSSRIILMGHWEGKQLKEVCHAVQAN